MTVADACDGVAPTVAREVKYCIHVCGKFQDPLFQKYRVAAEHLAVERRDVACRVEGFFETQFEQQLRNLVSRYGGCFAQAKASAPVVWAETEDSVLYFLNERRFLDWAHKRFKYEDNTRIIFYKRIGLKAMKAVKEHTGRSYCGLSAAVGDGPKETVHLELFDDECPVLARNFLDLLSDPGFDGHPVHRVKPGSWVQGGDLVDGSGLHSEAARGGLLRHESFQIPHDRAGLLGMANHGKGTNGSQFYITLRELPFLDGRSVIIGRVVGGMRAMLKIGKLAARNERPLQEVRIYAEPELTVVGEIQKHAVLREEDRAMVQQKKT